jgi:hypothetical protein
MRQHPLGAQLYISKISRHRLINLIPHNGRDLFSLPKITPGYWIDTRNTPKIILTYRFTETREQIDAEIYHKDIRDPKI